MWEGERRSDSWLGTRGTAKTNMLSSSDVDNGQLSSWWSGGDSEGVVAFDPARLPNASRASNEGIKGKADGRP